MFSTVKQEPSEKVLARKTPGPVKDLLELPSMLTIAQLPYI